jgi:thymidylate synthase (FAD)
VTGAGGKGTTVADSELHNQTKRTVSPGAEEILGLYFPVLDHGFVALVDYMGSDEDIERAARVSYGYGTRKRSQTRGLLRHLHRHGHTTPSEMVELKFHCCMPIFVARQWIRHRTANVNELSGRYSLVPMLFYTPPDEQLQAQSAQNRQGRAGQPLPAGLRSEAKQRWQDGRAAASATYDWLTSHEVARELARIDLPLSTYTQWYWKIDLHNLLHFLTLRVDAHAQWEIQQYGQLMAGMLKRVAPLSYEAWIDYDVCGARFSRMELDALRALLHATDDGVEGQGRRLERAALANLGLSSREVDEFLSTLRTSEVPDFELKLASARPAASFAERFAAAVPRGEREPGEG